jgi:hypothetical protein
VHARADPDWNDSVKNGSSGWLGIQKDPPARDPARAKSCQVGRRARLSSSTLEIRGVSPNTNTIIISLASIITEHLSSHL